MKIELYNADCLEKMKELEVNSVDSIVTDPPAGISFMSKSWDSDKGGRDHWIAWMQEVATECKRVLKPGGHAFVWAIPRTSHWTATAWENAGFEIREIVAHIFGSGFPKSLNIGKAVDKLQGNERETIREYETHDIRNAGLMDKKGAMTVSETKGTSEWEGWGTALKPAREDWLLMRKPLEKGLTIAENCLKWGTGGINIDESRVEYQSEDDFNSCGWSKMGKEHIGKQQATEGEERWTTGMKFIGDFRDKTKGRFPANLVLEDCEEVRECFPETAKSKSGGKGKPLMLGEGVKDDTTIQERGGYDDNGGNASRFFKSIIYQAKASKSERNRGLEGMPEKRPDERTKTGMGTFEEKGVAKQSNFHPTVKPIALMEYLIKMITRPGGVVLDPFAGSGSTLVAAKQNGFGFIGIELDKDYFEIAKRRIESVPETLF